MNFNFLDRFSENTHIKFHENLSGGNRVAIPVRDGRTDMTKLIFASRNFANSPKTQSVNVV